MTRSRKVGSRGRRVALAGAFAAVAAMSFGAASASAAPKSLTVPFDDAALTLPIVGTSDILDPPAAASITGTVDDPTGAITAGDLTFPGFTGTASGVPVHVDFDNTAPITGNLNLGSGLLTTTASTYKAVVQLSPPSGTVCTYDPITLTFSTSGGSPIAGANFTVANGASVSTSHGVLTANWNNATFPPATPTPPTGDCSLVDSIVHGGNGQLALGNGFDLTPATAAPPAGGGGTVAPPPKKKCKKAKKKKKKSGAQTAKKKGCKKKKKKK